MITRTYLLVQSTFYNTIYPVLYPAYALLLSRLNYETNSKSRPSDTAPILSLVITLLTLYVSLWALNFLRRRLFALISTLINVAFYAVILVLGIYVYNRGIEGTMDDVQLLLDLLGSLEKQGQKRGRSKASQKSWEAQRQGWQNSRQGRGGPGYRYG